jgi:hypothetical protein
LQLLLFFLELLFYCPQCILGYARTVEMLIRLGASREAKIDTIDSLPSVRLVPSALEIAKNKGVTRALLRGGLRELQLYTDLAYQRLKQHVVMSEQNCTQPKMEWLLSLSMCADANEIVRELGDPLLRSPLHFAVISGHEVFPSYVS